MGVEVSCDEVSILGGFMRVGVSCLEVSTLGVTHIRVEVSCSEVSILGGFCGDWSELP